MVRKLALIAVVAVGLGVASLAVPRARAQDPPQPERPAPTHKPGPWEYKVLSLEFREYRETEEWHDILAKHEKNELKADAAFKEYVLNFYAKEGWELDQVVSPKNELTIMYLRRAK
jgi:hypothetical protein